MTANPLAPWLRFRAARLWTVLLCTEGVTPAGTFTPAGCEALAEAVPGTPVAMVARLEHRPLEEYRRLGGPPAEQTIGTILDAHYAPGIGVQATLHLAESKWELHDVLLLLYASGELRQGPSLVFLHEDARSHHQPDQIIAAIDKVLAVDIVWRPGGGGRFLTPLAESPPVRSSRHPDAMPALVTAHAPAGPRSRCI